jgi:hypothetical protein
VSLGQLLGQLGGVIKLGNANGKGFVLDFVVISGGAIEASLCLSCRILVVKLSMTLWHCRVGVDWQLTKSTSCLGGWQGTVIKLCFV